MITVYIIFFVYCEILLMTKNDQYNFYDYSYYYVYVTFISFITLLFLEKYLF